jgi:hypothetical protein
MAIEHEQKIGMTAEKHFRRHALRAILALFDWDGCSVYGCQRSTISLIVSVRYGFR